MSISYDLNVSRFIFCVSGVPPSKFDNRCTLRKFSIISLIRKSDIRMPDVLNAYTPTTFTWLFICIAITWRQYYFYSQPRIFRLAIDLCSHCGTYRTARRLRFWQHYRVGCKTENINNWTAKLQNDWHNLIFLSHNLSAFLEKKKKTNTDSNAHTHGQTHTWCISTTSAQMLFSALARDCYRRWHLE